MRARVALSLLLTLLTLHKSCSHGAGNDVATNAGGVPWKNSAGNLAGSGFSAGDAAKFAVPEDDSLLVVDRQFLATFATGTTVQQVEAIAHTVNVMHGSVLAAGEAWRGMLFVAPDSKAQWAMLLQWLVESTAVASVEPDFIVSMP